MIKQDSCRQEFITHSRHASTITVCAVFSVILSCLGCGRGSTRVEIQYRLGDKLLQTKQVEVTASNFVETDWSNGTFPSLEVSWHRKPEIIFHEVWVGFRSSDRSKRELFGYTVNSSDRLRINYPSTDDLYLSVNLQDIPSRDRPRIKQVTLVYRIDDSEVLSEFDFALNQRAWRLATIPLDGARDGAQAVRLATRACEKSGWKNADYLDTLAASYAELGKFADATKTEQKALALLGIGDTRQAEFKARLSKYRLGQKHRALLTDF